ncbi:MAG: hypothetical protein Q8836_02600, partial [Sweet potato little leaf phytoplasma]|nr:hypothetical protein [Sweet potato little leaf phytoplasma]
VRIQNSQILKNLDLLQESILLSFNNVLQQVDMRFLSRFFGCSYRMWLSLGFFFLADSFSRFFCVWLNVCPSLPKN